MESTIKKIEESYDGSVEHPIITCEESHVQGFDPSTKKGFTTCTKSYRYHVLVCFGRNEYKVATRSKIVFDSGAVFDWHWREALPRDIKSFKVLEKCEK